MARNTVARVVHDVTLAAWFGGSLMGSLGVNESASRVGEPADRLGVANAGWRGWQPVQAIAIPLHLLSALQLTRANRGRVAAQRGVGRAAGIKALLTGLALLATIAAAVLGRRVGEHAGEPVASGVEPTERTPGATARLQRSLRLVQWAVPATTGAMLGVNALLGEQQRPTSVLRGVLARVGLRR